MPCGSKGQTCACRRGIPYKHPYRVIGLKATDSTRSLLRVRDSAVDANDAVPGIPFRQRVQCERVEGPDYRLLPFGQKVSEQRVDRYEFPRQFVVRGIKRTRVRAHLEKC